MIPQPLKVGVFIYLIFFSTFVIPKSTIMNLKTNICPFGWWRYWKHSQYLQSYSIGHLNHYGLYIILKVRL